jgi:putative phosphoribosyl transferase
MARRIAESLGGDLDVVLVHKLGAPDNPELAVGAVSEDGEVMVAPHAAHVGADAAYLRDEAKRQSALLRERRKRLSPVAQPADPRGRIVVVVDDGVATGATMLAALQILRRRSPARLVVAIGVAPPDTCAALRRAADEVVCLETPEDFGAVGWAYEDFGPVTDEEVLECLRSFRPPDAAAASPASGPTTEEVLVASGAVRLAGTLALPRDAKGLVIFAHGSGSSRFSSRNRFVAERLRARGLGTFLLDLLTEAEDRVRDNRFDIALLTERLESATRFALERRETGSLPLGYFGSSTGAACALRAAAALGERVAAVVSRGGRPDLATHALPAVTAPTLLIVGGADDGVIGLNEDAHARLRCEKWLAIVPGATHLFEEPGALEKVADLAAEWFVEHMSPEPRAAVRESGRT